MPHGTVPTQPEKGPVLNPDPDPTEAELDEFVRKFFETQEKRDRSDPVYPRVVANEDGWLEVWASKQNYVRGQVDMRFLLSSTGPAEYLNQQLGPRDWRISPELADEIVEKARESFSPVSVKGVTSSSQMLARTPAPWLVDGVFIRGSFPLVYGLSGAMKSFLALDLGMHVATGKDWCGSPVEQGAVLYAAVERTGRIMNRQQAWLQFHDVPKPPPLFNWYDESVDLTDYQSVKQLERAVSELDAKLLVIDTLNRSMRGSELSDDTMAAVVRSVDGLCKVNDTTVMPVHHTDKKGLQPRGYSNLQNAADAWFKMTKKGGGTTLYCVKQNDGPEGWQRRFEFREVEGTDSGVLVSAEGGRPSDKAGEVARRLSEEGHSQVAIADQLNELGLAPSRGKEWTRNSVKNLL